MTAHDSIVGRLVLDVGRDIANGTIKPDLFVISYTIDPKTGKNVTLNNRGWAAISSGVKPNSAIYVPYEKVPTHLVADIKNRPPSKEINILIKKSNRRHVIIS